jgi:hypothetical protein
MAASIKNTLIVPGESIGDFKLGTKLSEATKEMNDDVFYTAQLGHAVYFTINKIADNVPPEARKRIAGKFFDIDSMDSKLFNLQYPEFAQSTKYRYVFTNSTPILFIGMSMIPEDFDFFKKITSLMKLKHLTLHFIQKMVLGLECHFMKWKKFTENLH